MLLSGTHCLDSAVNSVHFTSVLMPVKSQWGMEKRPIETSLMCFPQNGCEPRHGRWFWIPFTQPCPKSLCWSSPPSASSIQHLPGGSGLTYPAFMWTTLRKQWVLLWATHQMGTRVVTVNATSLQGVRHQLISREEGFVLAAEKIMINENHYVLKNLMDQDYVHNHKKSCQPPLPRVKGPSDGLATRIGLDCICLTTTHVLKDIAVFHM